MTDSTESVAIQEAIPATSPPVSKRKPYKKRESSAEKKPSVPALAKQIEGIHILAATITGMPEIALTSNESALLAGALITLAGEYDLSMSGKTGAAIQLLGVAALIYVPRALTISTRIRADNEKKETG